MKAPAPDRSAAWTRRAIGTLAAGLLLLAAAWTLWPPRTRLVPAAPGEGEAFARGPFTEHSYCASDADLPPGLPARGSWLGSNEFTGTYVSGWFQARPRVTVMVSGYPRLEGNALALEVRTAAGVTRVPYAGPEPRENWRPWRATLPAVATAFRLVATDGSTQFYGWLGVSAPFETHLDLAVLPQAPRALLAFLGQGVLLLALALALHRGLRRRRGLPASLAWFAALAGVAGLGYAVFWAYFASPALGRACSWVVLAVATGVLLRPGQGNDLGDELLPPLALAAVTGLGFVALTCLFGDAPYSFLAANRFMANLPADNEIPRLFADRLWSGQSPRHLIGDWLSSDRPPLQTGWLLLTRPVLTALGLDVDTAAGTGGVWFQLLWIPAMWATLRRLGAGTRQSGAMIAAAAFTGFLLFYTIYTWPKLGAAALMLGAFVLWRPEPGAPAGRARFAAGGACAALGCLAHGGVAFTLLGLIPLGLATLWRERGAWRLWLAAGATFVAFLTPWLVYQRNYEPPGDRLLKWHLAGVIPPDGRGFGPTLVDSYRRIGWRGALANRWNNLRLQGAGDWRNLVRFRPMADPGSRRGDETTFTARTFGWWLPAGLLLPWLLWQRRREPDTILRWAAISWFSGWLVWLALMFLPDSARAHQGTLVTQLLGFSLLMWASLSLHRVVFLLLAAVQAVAFLTQWTTALPAAAGPLNLVSAVAAVAATLALAAVVWRHSAPGAPSL
ncbi:MAG TPA: hypothetical protein VMF63_08045 [Opitutaceae bacterium]|nr:hypothetical protein [Opitutaceae bacterium]